MNFEVGNAKVITTTNRGMTPVELAEIVAERLISISDAAHPVIRDQARAFREQMQAVIREALHRAQVEERATICARLHQAGKADLAAIIKEI